MSRLVSIIIPVYNAAPYLKTCLNSVMNQHYKSVEVIIINDGSTDHSEEIIKEYVKADARFKLYKQENRGLGYTRNRGISLSKAEYIFFLDSDDSIPEKAIQLLVTAIEKNNADYAVGKVVRLTDYRKYVPIRHLEFNLYNSNTVTTVLDNPELLQDSIACNKLWRKDLLTKNDLLFNEGAYYEDLSFTTKAIVLSKKIEIINDVVYHWRIRDNEDKPSITQQQMSLKNTLDRLNALSYNRQWLLKSGINRRVIKEHDLKSLLDVLRLHVIKYSLVKVDERDKWKRNVLSFLEQIPQEVAKNLPDKESMLYTLLMSKNFSDLMLFSKVLTNTEKTPLVIQGENNFIFKGEHRTFEVTHYFKPTVIVKDFKKMDLGWILKGELLIPKASYKTNGKFYIVNRKSKEKIFIDNMDSESTEENSCYPFEKQIFNVNLDIGYFLDYKKESVFDFYFYLEKYPTYSPARVRLNLDMKNNFNKSSTILTLYRTNYGNLSIRIQRHSLIKLFLKKCKNFLNRILSLRN